MEIAVIIPCHNAADVVTTQLDALAAQRTTRDWSVVVVDDGSTDDTVAVVERYREALPALTVVRRARREGTGVARNAGVAATDAPLLLFLDADDAVRPRYVEAMTAALDREALVTARIDYERLNPPEVLAGTPADHLCEVPAMESDFLPMAPGGLLGLRRDLFDRLGGHDPALPALADIDLCWRAQLAGAAIGVADTVVSVRMRGSNLGRVRRGRFQGRDYVPLLDKYAGLGALRLTWRRHLKDWLTWLLRLPWMGTPRRRGAISWDLGWQLGLFTGLLARWWTPVTPIETERR